jgi:Patatin-like phospholipase
MDKSLNHNAKFEDILAAEHLITGADKPHVGLAFSGGGIRSATLNLGVLEALAAKKLLDRFDYLSTVSGGGYIGAFFNSLIVRSGGIDAAQSKLGADIEPHEVTFLRKYSNYLTPKVGLSTDAIAAFSVWLTNTLLNQIVLISAIATICALGFWFDSLLENITSKTYLTWPGTAYIGLAIAFCAGLMAFYESFVAKTKIAVALKSHWIAILVVGIFGVTLTALQVATHSLPNWLQWMTLHPHDKVNLSAFWLLNPAVVAVISAAIIVLIGLVGRGGTKQIFSWHIVADSFMREWWARLGGVTIYLCGLWLLNYFLVLYLPLKLDALLSNHPLTSAVSWGTLASIGAFLGKSSATSGIETQKIKEKITIILPWVIIAGLIVLVSFSVFKLGTHFQSISHVYFWLAVLFAAITAVFAWRVDINVFSLHYFYRNRLTRAYLGATNEARKPSPFTGFDPKDDLLFSECAHRPLHIVNTALNLTNAKDLAWQQRLAASFAFTPLHAGFQFPDGQGNYQATDKYAGGIKLGSVVSVSGAAASPNGGYHTAPATAFLMTMFNARLGRWYGNPISDKWRKVSPPFGFSCLVKELFAKADIDSNYVYLSDGGHFENLGIYELVRRQCKLIIAVDAGQDGNYTFEDLGNAIRKCQVDLNITIDIDVKDIHPTQQSEYGNFKHAKKHYTIGEIIYDKTDPEKNGLLVYVKNSLDGHEPADLINFKLQEPAFPHHSTIDQFFDESQFESYRCLGKFITSSMLDELAKPSGLYERKVQTLLAI